MSAAPEIHTATRRVVGLSVEEVLALPAAVDVVTAGRALGIGRTKTFELIKTDDFPIPVLTLGKAFRCTKAALCACLELPLTP